MTAPRYMGLSDFVEEMSRHLGQMALGPSCRTRGLLLDTVEAATRRFLEQRLSPAGLAFALCRGAAEPGSEGVEPAVAFGTEFLPDLVVTVGDEPTVAIVARLVLRQQDAARQIASAIGQALVCSRKYPAALAFVRHASRDVAYKHFLDHELRTALWNSCKVKLVLHESPAGAQGPALPA